MRDEVERLKKVKKNQILNRIEKIRRVAGTNAIDNVIDRALDEDYKEENFNSVLDKYFGDDYYNEVDGNENEVKMAIDKFEAKNNQAKSKSVNEDGELEDEDDDPLVSSLNLDQDKQNALNPKPSIPIFIKNNLKPREVNDMKDEDLSIWWYCDFCLKGLKEYESRFDCSVCADYSLCSKCKNSGIHEKHEMKKFIIPQGCKPPTDEEIKDILNGFFPCKFCYLKMNNLNDYYQLKSDSKVNVCPECYMKECTNLNNNYIFIEAKERNPEDLLDKNPEKLKSEYKSQDIDNLVDEYYGIDFEDVIGGEIKTRFKYTNVKPESYDLTDEMLLFTDDNVLNSMVSLKRLAPYRPDQGFVKHKKIKKKLEMIRDSMKKNKKFLKSQIKTITSLEEKSKKIKDPKKKSAIQEEISEAKKILKSKNKATKESKGEDWAKDNNLEIADLTETKPKVSKDRMKAYGI